MAHPIPEMKSDGINTVADFLRLTRSAHDARLVAEIFSSLTRTRLMTIMHDRGSLTVHRLHQLARGPAKFEEHLAALVSAGLIRTDADHRFRLSDDTILSYDRQRDDEMLDTWIQSAGRFG